MNNFIHRPNQIEHVPTILASKVAGFIESPEYHEMRNYELNIPGVVCSHFAKYLQRLHQEQAHLVKTETLEKAISSAHEILNLLARSAETHALVTDEIFEAFDCSPDILEKIKSHLKPEAFALYERWQNSKNA